MSPRYFPNRLPDYRTGDGIPAPRLRALAENHVTALADVLAAQPVPSKPSVYTGAAGIAYSLWRAASAAHLPSAVQEELLDVAAGLARSALAAIQRQPQRHGCSLLDGHAGVYCTSALVLRSCALVAERQGEHALAADLFSEEQQCVQQFVGLHSLACDCEEDEVLYGRAGYLLGCLLLNRARPAGAISGEAIQQVVQAIIDSGRKLARLHDRTSFPTPLLYMWPPGAGASPYLGAAHGLMGILYALLHARGEVAAIPGAQQDVEDALRYVLSLECDASGQPGAGRGGHYPTRMGPPRGGGREPLVHWCHGATGAVFLLCKAFEQLGDEEYLEAALRSGEAVWERGLLKKGPGACHGVSGSAFAFLRLYRTGRYNNQKWLHRAVEFAKFIDSEEFRSGAHTPDHPLSLFEGHAAVLCLWADLLALPDGAAGGFPMFEVVD